MSMENNKEMKDYIKSVIKPRERMCSSRTKESYLKEHEPKIWEYLANNYESIHDDRDLYEILFCIVYDMEYKPICPICGKQPRKFSPTNKGYLAYCSKECQKSEKAIDLMCMRTAMKLKERYSNL